MTEVLELCKTRRESMPLDVAVARPFSFTYIRDAWKKGRASRPRESGARAPTQRERERETAQLRARRCVEEEVHLHLLKGLRVVCAQEAELGEERQTGRVRLVDLDKEPSCVCLSALEREKTRLAKTRGK